MASRRIFFASSCGAQTVGATQWPMSTCLPSTAIMMGPPPVVGMWRTLTPVAFRIISHMK